MWIFNFPTPFSRTLYTSYSISSIVFLAYVHKRTKITIDTYTFIYTARFSHSFTFKSFREKCVFDWWMLHLSRVISPFPNHADMAARKWTRTRFRDKITNYAYTMWIRAKPDFYFTVSPPPSPFPFPSLLVFYFIVVDDFFFLLSVPIYRILFDFSTVFSSIRSIIRLNFCHYWQFFLPFCISFVIPWTQHKWFGETTKKKKTIIHQFQIFLPIRNNTD